MKVSAADHDEDFEGRSSHAMRQGAEEPFIQLLAQLKKRNSPKSKFSTHLFRGHPGIIRGDGLGPKLRAGPQNLGKKQKLGRGHRPKRADVHNLCVLLLALEL